MANGTGNTVQYVNVPVGQAADTGPVQRTKKPRRYYDYTLFFLTVLLSAFGLLMIYSSSYFDASVDSRINDGAFFFRKQAISTAIGIVLMFWVSKMNYRKLVRWFALLGYVLSIVLMLLTNYTSFGIELNHSKRWFGIGGHSLFQSAEPVKIGLIVFVTFALVKLKNRIDKYRCLLLLVALSSVPILLVAKYNLSSAIILALIVFGMIFVASQKKVRFAVIAGIAVVLVVVVVLNVDWIIKRDIMERYRLMRVLVWRDPLDYSSEGGFQVLQGLYAIGSGGFFGKGLGNGVQKLGLLPEAQNDMIFAIICEELGLFGAVCVMLLFAYMLYRFLIIARNAPDTMGVFIVAGVFIHIAVQVVLNIAVVTNFIPNTGVTLPFISYGGTSVLFLMVEVGLVLSVANRIELKG